MTSFQRFQCGLLAACFLSLTLAACDSADSDPDLNVAPPVLSAEAFDFGDAMFPDEQARSGGQMTRQNFNNAAFRFGIVTLAVGANLVIPHLATAAALNTDPVIESGTWVWSNTVRIGMEDVRFRLEGTPDGNDVLWSMRITTTDPETDEVYDDFVLYTARGAFDGQTGSWELYYRVEGVRTRVLEADFVATSATQKTVTFSVPEGVGEAGGDSVIYERDGDDRSFDWTQVGEGFNHFVEWDAVTEAGSITATNYNGGERACWDETLEDASCN